ncbi:hypothetical protein Tco_0655762 [Tanacetum coccineum]|uniref:Uncharacterized protein n=1 Tax=Tanacetum coccineum TaxID=301880 RepID=A0ABQ4X7C8_9ASTR
MTSSPLPKLEEAFIVLTIYRAKTLLRKAIEKKNNWKKAVNQRLDDHEQRLNALSQVNNAEAIKKYVQATIGEKRIKRQKGAGGSLSKRGKAQDDSPYYERGDDAEELRQEERHKHEVQCKSRHEVYSKLNIISVESIKVFKKYFYAYLEETVIKRTYEKEYMFAEADFLNLNQNDIEDLYLLKIQNKIGNIKGVEDFDLINSL